MKKTIALTLAAIALFLVGCCTTRHAVGWQYQTVASISDVNKMAAEGWAVAGYSEYSDAGGGIHQSFLLKRPKQ